MSIDGPEGRPRLEAPAEACDCHMHVYDAALAPIPGTVTPGPDWATAEAYARLRDRLGITRSVVVQPTAYGTDNQCTLGAIAELGRDRTRGVAVVDDSVGDPELRRLTDAGIRGARFQMLPGGVLPWDMLAPVARRIAPFGWHIQLQMDGRLLAERAALLNGLPCPLVIDHVGKFLEPVPVQHPGFGTLLRLLDRGRTWLKLSGPYEVSRTGGPDYADVAVLAKAAVAAAPERMVWASNWPHVSVPWRPDDAGLLDLLLAWAPDASVRRRILVDNPAQLYGF
jgi:D-galactarolactone isomerase